MNDVIRISSARPFFNDESINEILQDIRLALKTGCLIDGPYGKNFENQFAEYSKTKYAVSVSSATAALEITLRYFGLKGREVIVPTNTFVATPNSVIFAGGKPVFADIKEHTLSIDPADVKKKLSPRTAGIIVVHLSGLICPQMNELVQLCKERGLFLLEDAAHAHGAMLNGKMAGALSDAGCFSFYPTKIMTSGLGGMITTDDSKLAEVARLMRTHGQNSQGLMMMLGDEWRLSEIAAIVGKHQLDHLEQFLNRRNEIAEYYNTALRDLPGISLFQTPTNMRNSYYKYPLKLDEGIDRENLANKLRKEYGIETGYIYWPPCHLHPFYIKNFGTGEGDLPVSENVLKRVLCLPMHVAMTDEDAKYVAESVRSIFARLH